MLPPVGSSITSTKYFCPGIRPKGAVTVVVKVPCVFTLACPMNCVPPPEPPEPPAPLKTHRISTNPLGVKWEPCTVIKVPPGPLLG